MKLQTKREMPEGAYFVKSKEGPRKETYADSIRNVNQPPRKNSEGKGG